MTIPETRDKRRFPRIQTENSVGYVLYNASREKVGQGSGRTINLSQTGILLETKRVLNGSFVVLVTIDLKGENIRVTGKVVSSRYVDAFEGYLTGIEFIGPKTEQVEAIVAFVKAHLRRKHQAVS